MRRVKFGEKSGIWVLRLLGMVLLAAAGLKAHQLLTEPMANANIWSNRNFHIFQVEFELALGLWLLSGWRKRLAWLAALACFGVFSAMTLYKGITGADSCGCFGRVHVNPWITLFAVDLPAVAALAFFRPIRQIRQLLSPTNLFPPMPQRRIPALPALCGMAVLLAASTALLALNEPAKATPEYVVLEPETWIGKELPILEHIDIADQLLEGNWLIMLYHHDCPDCQKAVPRYEQMARYLEGNEDIFHIALIEVPPYGVSLLSSDSKCKNGRLMDAIEWFVTTPVVMYTHKTVACRIWEHDPPELDDILEVALTGQKNTRQNKEPAKNAYMQKTSKADLL